MKNRFIAVSLLSGILAGCSCLNGPDENPGAPEGNPAARSEHQGARTMVASNRPVAVWDGKEKVVKSEEEWRKQLSPIAYHVTREKGTEPAFTGAFWDNHEKGTYRCVACGLELFSSDTKYDSGTGWPSFYAPIRPENVATDEDFTLGVGRTEVKCPRCDSHLGHVFNDGPKPTGLRYCMNSAALDFQKKD